MSNNRRELPSRNLLLSPLALVLGGLVAVGGISTTTVDAQAIVVDGQRQGHVIRGYANRSAYTTAARHALTPANDPFAPARARVSGLAQIVVVGNTAAGGPPVIPAIESRTWPSSVASSDGSGLDLESYRADYIAALADAGYQYVPRDQSLSPSDSTAAPSVTTPDPSRSTGTGDSFYVDPYYLYSYRSNSYYGYGRLPWYGYPGGYNAYYGYTYGRGYGPGYGHRASYFYGSGYYGRGFGYGLVFGGLHHSFGSHRSRQHGGLSHNVGHDSHGHNSGSRFSGGHSQRTGHRQR